MNESTNFAEVTLVGVVALFGVACHAGVEPTEASPAPVVAIDVPPPEARLAQDQPADPVQPVYDPCDGKTCGDPCQLCPPGSDETCVEPPRQCDARGACTNVPPACMADDAP